MTKVWDILDLCGGNKGWVVYHNNQRLGHHKVSVHHGDVFACYERNNCNTPLFKRIEWSMMQPWERVANALAPEPSEAVEPLASELLPSDAVGDDSHVGTATFEQTGNPLLLIGRASGQRSQGLPCRVPVGERYSLLDLYFACATMDTNIDVFFDDHRVLQLVVTTSSPSPSITWEGEKCLAFD